MIHPLGPRNSLVFLLVILGIAGFSTSSLKSQTPDAELLEDSLYSVSLEADSVLVVDTVLIDEIVSDSILVELTTVPVESRSSTIVPDYQTETFDSVPFGVGERLRYHLDFSFVQAGLSEMAIVDIDTSTGRPAFHFRSRARSTRSIDLFFKVRDQVDAWFDTESLYSHRYERRIHEGGYHSLKYYDYNSETGWVSISNEHGPKGVTPFEPFTHNIISALYWVRTQKLEKGVDLHLPLHDLTVQYPLTVKVYGREKVKVPAGEWMCWKVEPVIESEGLFNMTGSLIVWLTDDELRLPVKMSSSIPVGSIQGVLVEYRLGKEYEPENAPDYGKELDWDW